MNRSYRSYQGQQKPIILCKASVGPSRITYLLLGELNYIEERPFMKSDRIFHKAALSFFLYAG